MALYNVYVNGDVKPDALVSALVIAGGTGQARKAVAHLADAKTLVAERIGTTGVDPYILNAQFADPADIADASPDGTQSLFSDPASN